MKGGMILSLVTLCVVMLFMEARISRFLHGEPEPATSEESFFDKAGEAFNHAGDAIAGFWKDLTGLIPSSSGSGTSEDGKVVITEDTVKQVWVWQEQGSLQSARTRPDRDDASQVLIPENMTAKEFFADTGSTSSGNSDKAAASDEPGPGGDTQGPETEQTDPGLPSSVSGNGARETLEQMSPEQRRAMMKKGMGVLQRHGQGSGTTPEG